jgi:hypothetical protein
MIEFTEKDRRMLLYAAGSIEVQFPGFAKYLRELAERRAGDAGLRKWLNSVDAREMAASALSPDGRVSKADFQAAQRILAALADSTEGGRS